MKVGMVLPDAGQQATKENISMRQINQKKKDLIHYGYGREFYVL
jgi:hypothetical protein